VKEPSGLLIVRAATVESFRSTVTVAEEIGCLPSVTLPVMDWVPGEVLECLIWANDMRGDTIVMRGNRNKSATVGMLLMIWQN
jgi:hypothetical protein